MSTLEITAYGEECILDAHLQQHVWGYFAFKSLLTMIEVCPVVQKICHLIRFQAENRLRVDKVWTTGCFFCAAFTSYIYEEGDRGHTATAKKPTRSMNSHQKTEEYMKGKSPLFIL